MTLKNIQNHSSLVLVADIKACDYRQFVECLAGKERERLSRIKRSEDQKLFIVSHALKRLILAQYASLPASSLEFATNEYGKPYCTHPGVPYFNISHSRNCIVLAISVIAEIGVDVEFPRSVENLSIMRRICSQNQLERYLTSDDPDKAFLAFWTQKEAVSKAVGRGIAMGLKKIPCTGEFGTQQLEFQGKIYHLLTYQLPGQGVLSCAMDINTDFGIFELTINNKQANPKVGDFMSNVLKSACKVM